MGKLEQEEDDLELNAIKLTEIASPHPFVGRKQSEFVWNEWNKLSDCSIPQTSQSSSQAFSSPTLVTDRPKTSLSVIDVPPEFLAIQEKLREKNNMTYWSFNLDHAALFVLILGLLTTAGDIAIQTYLKHYYYTGVSGISVFFYIFAIIGNRASIRNMYIPQIIWNLIYVAVYMVLFFVQLLRYSPFHHHQDTRQDLSLEEPVKHTHAALQERWEDRLYTVWVGLVVLVGLLAFKVVYRHFYILETNEITGATDVTDIIEDDILDKLRAKLGKISEDEDSTGSK